MTNENIYKFREKLKVGLYFNAYEILIIAYEDNPKDDSLPELAKELLLFVQKKAMSLGYNKATEMSREAAAIDVLHRLVKLFISKL